MKKVKLGNTGLEVTKVGLGMRTVGATQLNLTINQSSSVLKYALDCGINYIDTAQYYKTYSYIRKALENTNFEPIICSKCLSPSYQEMTEAIEEARREIDRDVIDIFMLHELTTVSEYEYRIGAVQALVDAKAKGRVRAIGAATHYVDVAEDLAKRAEMDVIAPLINFRGLGIRDNRTSDGSGTRTGMATAIRNASAAGKGIVGSKVFGGGYLVNNYQEALDYTNTVEGLDCITISMGKKREVDDICAYLNGTLSLDYSPDMSLKRIFVDQAECEGCGACISRCPSRAISFNENGLAEVNHDICITCGFCGPACPVRAIFMIDERDPDNKRR